MTEAAPDRHAPESRLTITRRRLLQGAAAASIVSLAHLERLRDAGAVGAPLAASDRVLVVVQLEGGACGLTSVVPYTDGAYYAARGSLAVPAASVRPLADGSGLHPELAFVKERYDAGEVAVLLGVGHPDGELSHFAATAKVVTGAQGSESTSGGIIGRYVDALGGEPFSAVAVGSSVVPLLLQRTAGSVLAVPLASSGLFGADRALAPDGPLFDTLMELDGAGASLGTHGDLLQRAWADAVRDATTITPAFSDLATSGEVARQFALAAHLINLDVGTRVLHIRLAGYDTHSDHVASSTRLLRALDDGLRTFFDRLAPQYASRVAVATITEFGRRVRPNGSGGTDHGTSSVSFVLGARVNGGLWGSQPSLTSLDDNGNLRHSVDVRSVHASLLGRWLQADDTAILGRRFDQLDLFRAAPACPAMSTNLRTGAAGYVPMAPVRILDTRLGNGAARRKLPAGAELVLQVAGRGTAPANGIGAVVLNLTVAEPDSGGYLTVWPSGEPRPVASSSNFARGQTVPNLVVTRVGGDGTVRIFNGGGDVHVIGDLCGWFPTDNPYRPVVPARLLDSRNGIARRGQLGPGETMVLNVVGQAGVPGSGVGAVVLNVTGTEPDAISYLTVWPSDSPRPTASNLNLVPGTTTPNLVIARVAPDGTVSMYNERGRVHVLADVFGWFPVDAGYHPLVPRRILDSRIGTGIRGRLRENGTVHVDALCRGDVPVNASAVVVNVTVAEPTSIGYLTVWPAGQPRPNASNLNFVSGQVVPNLAIVRVGIDGMMSLFNERGTPHVIADVMGWFE